MFLQGLFLKTLLAVPAPLPSAIYTCRVRPQHWSKDLAAETNTRFRYQPFSLC